MQPQLAGARKTPFAEKAMSSTIASDFTDSKQRDYENVP
jgi:hypothetical protein